jgi:hypothetical protein
MHGLTLFCETAGKWQMALQVELMLALSTNADGFTSSGPAC